MLWNSQYLRTEKHVCSCCFILRLISAMVFVRILMKIGPDAQAIPEAIKETQRSVSVFSAIFKLIAEGGKWDRAHCTLLVYCRHKVSFSSSSILTQVSSSAQPIRNHTQASKWMAKATRKPRRRKTKARRQLGPAPKEPKVADERARKIYLRTRRKRAFRIILAVDVPAVLSRSAPPPPSQVMKAKRSGSTTSASKQSQVLA
mmetsp:Transcript_6974/g.16602  ORF Transcript_6974/g.16602 Transcript_6974/m.16602 type:complete len:202 (-) Transcript_6974:931-1536(-)